MFWPYLLRPRHYTHLLMRSLQFLIPGSSSSHHEVNPRPVVEDYKSRPRDSFAEPTLFLFGGGVALFVALLGWSDEIRGINKDTLDLEQKFLKATKIDRQIFSSVVKPVLPISMGFFFLGCPSGHCSDLVVAVCYRALLVQ